MMQERGVNVDPTTIMRWVHRYAPELEKRVRAYQGYGSTSWRVDETYVRVAAGGSTFTGSVATIRPGQGRPSRCCRRRQAGWGVKPFIEHRDGFRKRTDTDAEGAFDNAGLAADVLGEVEDGRLALA